MIIVTSVILRGCCGNMGRVVSEIASTKEDIKIVAGVDIRDNSNFSYPVFTSFDEVPLDANVIIDFSNSTNTSDLFDFAIKKSLPIVIAATGQNEEQLRSIREASKHIPIFISSNMSIGINLLSELAKAAAKVLGEQFDIEIVEAHHNQKIDAPSGTAISLCQAIEEGLEFKPALTYERHTKREKRNKTEIGMHSIRGGTIVGEHDIIFAGHDEIIKLSHSALSKNIFAIGAINAAKYLSKKTKGMYSMKDLVREA